jgi:DinB family protein
LAIRKIGQETVTGRKNFENARTSEIFILSEWDKLPFMRLIAILEAGRRDFLDAAREISPEQACAKPTAKCWSVVECAEHVIAVEDRYLSWISSGREVAPRRDFEKEMRLFDDQKPPDQSGSARRCPAARPLQHFRRGPR